LATLLAVGAVWEAVAAYGIVDPFFISRPSAILGRLGEWILDGSIVEHTLVTLAEAAAGFGVAAVLGIGGGLLLARYPLVDAVSRPFIDVFNTIPRIALAPLFVLWFGLTMRAKIALVFSVALFSFLINTYAGAKSVDAEFVRMARSLGASRWDLVRKIILPSIVPWVLAGARLGVAYSLAAAVIGEIVSANKGLGFRIAFAAGVLDTAGEFAAIVVLACVAWVANTGVARLESRLLRWKAVEQQRAGWAQ
jgi:NitT/TauT family transport system permease protein